MQNNGRYKVQNANEITLNPKSKWVFQLEMAATNPRITKMVISAITEINFTPA